MCFLVTFFFLSPYRVTYPSKLPSVLEADSQQKVVVRFQLVAAGSTKPLGVHQAFLRLWNDKTKQEIIFNAEKDSSKTYKFDMVHSDDLPENHLHFPCCPDLKNNYDYRI